MKSRFINQNKVVIIDEILEIFFINSLPSTEHVIIDNHIKIELSEIENFIEFEINLNDSLYNSFVISMNYEILLENSSLKLVFVRDNILYSLDSNTCNFEVDNDGYITIRTNQDIANFTLSYNTNDDIFIKAYEPNVTFIDENSSMPEFSISTFDDSAFTIPRPVRHGIPIISTVPSYITNSSSSADISYYNLGIGPNLKTIYFRIICNKIMENISQDAESAMRLKIYLPNGLDTVKKATYIPMYLVSNDSTNNISIYRSSYDFYSQGYFDGIEYVDGYTQCDVQVPLTIQKVMPFEFDFNLL